MVLSDNTYWGRAVALVEGEEEVSMGKGVMVGMDLSKNTRRSHLFLLFRLTSDDAQNESRV